MRWVELGKTFYLSSRYHARNSSDEKLSEKPTKVYVCSPISFWYHTSILKINFHLKGNSYCTISTFHIFMMKCKKPNVWGAWEGLSPNLIQEKELLLASVDFRFGFRCQRNVCFYLLVHLLRFCVLGINNFYSTHKVTNNWEMFSCVKEDSM